MRRRDFAAALTAWMVGGGGADAAEDGYEVYFLAVGSTHYAAPAAAGTRGFATLSGANKSARAVAERLVAGGARYGEVLTSGPGAFVRLADINAALTRVEAELRRGRPKSPLLVVYVASHGISEGVGWNHFSIPGDFLYRGRPDRLPIDRLTETTLHAATFADRLGKAGARYLLILDSCYEGKAAQFESPVLTATAQSNLGDIAAALRALNEFRQPSPVLFSTAPGSVVQTVADAQDPDPQATPVAPLARRFMLLTDRAPKSTITLANLVRGMSDPRLDSATSPAVTHAEPTADWSKGVLRVGLEPGQLRAPMGTGKAGALCCSASL